MCRYRPPAERYWPVHFGCSLVCSMMVLAGHGDKVRWLGQGWGRAQIEEWASLAEANGVDRAFVFGARKT